MMSAWAIKNYFRWCRENHSIFSIVLQCKLLMQNVICHYPLKCFIFEDVLTINGRMFALKIVPWNSKFLYSICPSFADSIFVFSTLVDYPSLIQIVSFVFSHAQDMEMKSDLSLCLLFEWHLHRAAPSKVGLKSIENIRKWCLTIPGT